MKDRTRTEIVREVGVIFHIPLTPHLVKLPPTEYFHWLVLLQRISELDSGNLS
jgi:hypothetical protein